MVQVKLINFKNFKPFQELKELMNITEEDEISINDGISFKIDEIFWNEVKSTGALIPKEELIKHEDYTLGVKGSDQRIIVYIKEQYFDPDFEEKEYKFHISWCKTLEQMYEGKRYDRYVAVQKEEPEFLVDLINLKNRADIRKNITKKMSVCKNCLTKLNYKGYATAGYREKQEIYKKFSLKEFLEIYNKTEILVIPKTSLDNKDSNVYTEDWETVSFSYRLAQHWKCEKCGKNCIDNKSDLHVHHKDGNKRNNSYSNLMALCSRCHSEMPYHEHMKMLRKGKKGY